MANPTLEEARALGYKMASGYAPRGEACFEAGKLICQVTSAALYVVPVTEGNGTEFVIVFAASATEARDMVKAEFAVGDDALGEVEDAVGIIDSQYNGMAILGSF